MEVYFSNATDLAVKLPRINLVSLRLVDIRYNSYKTFQQFIKFHYENDNLCNAWTK